MTKQTLIVLFSILFLNPILHASTIEDWNIANKFYSNKQYDSAALYFEKIATKKPDNAVLYYNLGNTYYRLNNIGQAVLNYQKALKRQPDLKDAKENLALTESRIPGYIPETKPIFFVRWWQSITAPGNITFWAVTALVLFIISLALLALKRLMGTKIAPQIIGFGIFFSAIFALIAIIAGYKSTQQIAVIMTDDASINKANNKGTIPLPQGTTVHILNKTSNAYHIALQDGREGAIPATKVIIVD
jgi:tetratricopeptide (TPR) repeat protein